jgi:UDP-glucose 4-epimerase
VNLGTGKGSSVFDVLHAFEKACGRELPYKVLPRRAGDIAWSYAEPKKALELFGWQAQFGLDDMCRDGWNFAQKNPDGL